MNNYYWFFLPLLLINLVSCNNNDEEIAKLVTGYDNYIKNLDNVIDSLKQSNKKLFNKLPYSIRVGDSRHIPIKKNYPYKAFRDKHTELMGISDLKDSVIIEPKYHFTKILTNSIGLTYEWAKPNPWKVINLDNQSTITDSIYGISDFIDGKAAIMTFNEDIYIIDTMFTIIDTVEYEYRKYNHDDSEKLKWKFNYELLPSQKYSNIFDYIDDKGLYADSIRYFIIISPTGESSEGIYVQKLKYGMNLFFTSSWESYKCTLQIPYISKEMALLFALRLNIMQMDRIIRFRFDDDKIELRYKCGYNSKTLRIRDYDSVYVEISF